MAEDAELVQVWETQGIDLANIYKSKLEAMGIPVLLKYESVGLILGVTVDGIGRVRLFVPAVFATDAEDVLRDESAWEEGDELTWDETGDMLGEEIEPGE